MEKGNPDAKGAIKRTLHTWKGEFGVLDLQDYSRIIHELEGSIEAGAVTAEYLLRFEDFLQEKLAKASRGLMPPLLKSEKGNFFPQRETPPARAAESKAEKEPIAQPAPSRGGPIP